MYSLTLEEHWPCLQGLSLHFPASCHAVANLAGRCCSIVVRIQDLCGMVTPHVQRWPLQTCLATMETPKSRGREKLCMRGVCASPSTPLALAEYRHDPEAFPTAWKEVTRRPWTTLGGSGGLSEIPADNDHMSAVWGQFQSLCLPPSIQLYFILCLAQLLWPGWVLSTADWPLASARPMPPHHPVSQCPYQHVGTSEGDP